MKNRRITLAAFLLIAVLVMGIGFAAVTDNLEINGEASANTTEATKDFDADVYFSAAEKVASASASTVLPTYSGMDGF